MVPTARIKVRARLRLILLEPAFYYICVRRQSVGEGEAHEVVNNSADGAWANSLSQGLPSAVWGFEDPPELSPCKQKVSTLLDEVVSRPQHVLQHSD